MEESVISMFTAPLAPSDTIIIDNVPYHKDCIDNFSNVNTIYDRQKWKKLKFILISITYNPERGLWILTALFYIWLC